MKLKIFLSLFILFFIGLIVFWKTFSLEIYGDEWEGIWWTTSTLQTTGHFNDRVGYKSYELAAIMLNFISGASSLNYNSTQVYFFSFFTRIFATFCLYYFLSKRSISKIGVFVGSLLFLITPIGIQTTDWAKNFTSYISIGFFLLCLNSLYDLTNWKKVLIFLATFLLSIYVNPIRAHGIIFTIFSLVTVKLLFQSENRKLLTLSLSAVLLVPFILSKFSVFGDATKLQDFYIQNLVTFFNQMSLGKFNELFILVGKGVIPNFSFISLFLLLAALFYWKRKLFSKKSVSILAIAFLPLLFILWPVTNEKLTIILGIYFSAFLGIAFFIELFTKKTEDAINTSIPLLLNLFFILIPFILGRTDVTESTHRYLIYSALSLPMIVAFSLKDYRKISFNLNAKNLFFCVCLILIGLFFISIKKEIDNFYNRHNQIIAKTIWSKILPHFRDFDFQKRRAIVYLEGDDGGVLQDAVAFGFAYHLGFIYRIWDFDHLPVAVDSKKDLESWSTDSKVGIKYIQKESVFPKEDMFHFRVEGTKVIRIPI